MSLAVIIVAWNVKDMLRRCLRHVIASLARCEMSATLLVVDNASSDGTAAMIREEFPTVWLCEAGTNRGFAAANNLAFRELGFFSPAAFPPEAVLLLNPDTVPLADAIPWLIRALEQHPDVAVVGPQLRYPDGRIQSSRRRFPSRMTLFWESTVLERWWPTNPWVRHYRYEQPYDPDDTTPQRVEWLVGAALLVRGMAITKAGGFDERFFLYSEELEWQYRLCHTDPRWRTAFYEPRAVVIHDAGGSSRQVPEILHRHFQRSKILLAQMWYGQLLATLLMRFLQVNYLWELLSEGGKDMIGHRRPLRRERIQTYARVLHTHWLSPPTIGAVATGGCSRARMKPPMNLTKGCSDHGRAS